MMTDQEFEKMGVEAIIAMQKVAGIEETHDQALAGWRGMKLREKQSTLNAYKHFCSNSDTWQMNLNAAREAGYI